MSLWPLSHLRQSTRATWGLDPRELAWRPDGERKGAALRAPHAEALPRALAQLAPGTGVDLIAGNDIAVYWLQTPPSSVASLQELRLVAAARCSHLYGGTPTDWWIAAEWDAAAPFVCAALPYSTVRPLQQRLEAAGIAARWHTAWGVACDLDADSFPDDGWSALRSPHRFVLWHCREGRVDCLSMHSVTPDTADEDANAQALRHIRVECLRDSSLAKEPLHWVSIATPGNVAVNEAVAALELGVMLERATS